MTKFLSEYRAFVTLISFVKDIPKDRGNRGQKPFLYINKCHNSVINYGILPINNPKRDIAGINAYVKFE